MIDELVRNEELASALEIIENNVNLLEDDYQKYASVRLLEVLNIMMKSRLGRPKSVRQVGGGTKPYEDNLSRTGPDQDSGKECPNCGWSLE